MKRGEDNYEFLEILGSKIRKIRKEQRLTQKQLAFECGIDYRQIQRIEKGIHNAGILTFRTICNVLDIEFSKLISDNN